MGRRVGIAVAVLVFASCGSSAKPPGVAPPRGDLEFRRVLAMTPNTALASCGRGQLADSAKTVCFALGSTLLTGENVATARAELNPDSGSWVVELHFANDDFVTKVATPEVGRQIAIVLDNVVLSAPTVNPGIVGRDVTISGEFDEAAARRVAASIAPSVSSGEASATTPTTTAIDELMKGFDKRCAAAVTARAGSTTLVATTIVTGARARAAFERAHKPLPDALARVDDGERLALCEFAPGPPVGEPLMTRCPNGTFVMAGPIPSLESLTSYAVDEHLTATRLPEVKHLFPEMQGIPTPDVCAGNESP